MMIMERDVKGRFVKGVHYNRETEFKKGLIPWIKGRQHTEKTKCRISEVQIGKHHSPETEFKKRPHTIYKRICPQCNEEFSTEKRKQRGRKQQFCSPSCNGKWYYQNSQKSREALKLGGTKKYKLRGEDHPNWKGGTYEGNRKKDEGRSEYKKWRRRVFERDNFTCVICKEVGGELNAHHIKPYVDYPELRYDVNNGITLCEDCHIAVHRDELDCLEYLDRLGEKVEE